MYFRNFYELDTKTISKLIMEEQKNIKHQQLVNIKNWKKMINGIKLKHAKAVKLHHWTVLGKWLKFSNKLLS